MVAAMQQTRQPSLPARERLERLRLARTENIGPITYRQLIDRFGSAAAALEALPGLARRGGRARPLRICPRDRAERERDALDRMGGTLVFPGEAAYPEALAILDHAPMVLSVLGDPALLSRRAVAIVGARNASTGGRRFAQQIAADLAAAGLVVVSGLARGIDAAAHRGALDSTVAVVAGGVDVIYPRENQGLYAEIRAKGAIVTEMPLGVQPQARHFPRRNRIISGLSLGVLVVEAALRSGSLITARLAAEQGRDVFAVPGAPADPRCRGPNDLIRKGAKLTEDAEDILTELAATIPPPVAPSFPLPPPTERPAEPETAAEAPPADLAERILERLGPARVSVDDLIRDIAEPPGLVRGALLELELAGRIERQPGDKVARLYDHGESGN
jgi:DNA processing protein